MAGKPRTAEQAAALLASLGIERSEDAARDETGLSAVWATVYFDGDSVDVGDDYVELVRQCAERFKDSRAGTLIVSGHAAGVDEPEQEVLLSHARTRAVAELLESLGVLSHQILCVSRGANEPLVDPSDPARRWINRRVEIREGALVPRPPAWAQQRRKKKSAAVEKSVPADNAAAKVKSATAAKPAPAEKPDGKKTAAAGSKASAKQTAAAAATKSGTRAKSAGAVAPAADARPSTRKSARKP